MVFHRERTHEFRGQATCLLDVEGHFLNVSPSLAAFFHSDGNRLRGENILGRMDRGEAAQVAGRLAEVAAGRGAAHFQVRLVSPGGPTWVGMHLSPGAGPEPFIVAAFDRPGAM